MLTFTATRPGLSVLLGNSRVVLALLALFALFLGRFWWFGETTSWAGFIRICLFLGLLLALAEWRELLPFLRRNGYAVLLLGFLAYLAGNSLVLGDGKTARRVLLLVAFFLAVPLVAARGKNALRQLLALMVVASALVAAVTFVTLNDQGLLSFEYRLRSISASGVAGFADFENSVLAGLELAFSGVVMLWVLLQARTWPARAFWIGCGLLIALYVFLTFSRTGWLALAVSALMLLFNIADRRLRKHVLIAIALTGLLFVVLFHERIAYELFSRKLSYREEIWQMVLQLMPGYWPFGHGADTGVAQTLGLRPLAGSRPMLIAHAHSIYLEVLFNYGLFGLGYFVVLLLAACRRLYAHRHEPLTSLWLAVLIGAMVAMVFDFSSFVSTPNLLWLWLWLPLVWALALSPGATADAAMINADSAVRSTP